MNSSVLKNSDTILTDFDYIETLMYIIDNETCSYTLSLGVAEDLDKIVLFEERFILDRHTDFEQLCLILNSKTLYDVCFTCTEASFDEHNHVVTKEQNYIYSRHAVLKYYDKVYMNYNK